MSNLLLNHGSLQRGLHSVPRGRSYEGRFGRMFRSLPPLQSTPEDLALLAGTMIESDSDEVMAGTATNNATVTAGYTYLGQFIDHDITFDPVSELQGRRDPEGVRNFRTPRFDLDSMYGAGRAGSPFMFDSAGRFVLGLSHAETEDLLRIGDRAVIPDPRNDENLIVSQLHLAFLKYHNRIVDAGETYESARCITQWHYQWLVLHDYLPKIIGQPRVDELITRRVSPSDAVSWSETLQYFSWKRDPFMPVEFSAAAFRFGHSMVRQRYHLTTAEGLSRGPRVFDPSANDPLVALDLRGFRKRPVGSTIQWFRFFDVQPKPGELPGGEDNFLQSARAFDTLLAHGLSTLPSSVVALPAPASGVGVCLSSLAVRNLLRGQSLGLPSGQSVARAMGLPEGLVLSARRPPGLGMFSGFPSRILPNGQPDKTVPPAPAPATSARLEAQYSDDTPLWYYILKEAELLEGGQRLGPVGARIVGEVFVGLLIGDREAFVNVEPDWRPEAGSFGCLRDGEFGIVDLLKYAFQS